jgi:hypothetical protein
MSDTPYTITRESVTVILDGQTYTVKRGDPNFEDAKDVVLSERWDDLPALLNKGLALEKWAQDMGTEEFVFQDNHLHYQGERIPMELNQRMLEMANRGEDPTFLMKFWARLQLNPSWRSVQELYRFLENKGIAIDQDGYILMYKSVRPNWNDWYSDSVCNKVGEKPWMARNKVSDEYNSACHIGFHAGNLAYAQGFHGGSGRVIIVKVDPKDVVTVCSTAQKVRMNTYGVIGVHGAELPNTVYDTSKDEALSDAASKVADKLSQQRGSLPSGIKEPWQTFGDLGDDQLAGQNMDNLRKYASRVLKIVGASKLRKEGVGGLVAAIVKARRKAE